MGVQFNNTLIHIKKWRAIMKLYFAADHAGVSLKTGLVKWAQWQEHDVKDLGTDSSEISVDYPDYALAVSKAMGKAPEAYGILICGSGMGMAIAANRHKHIRAVLCHTSDQAYQARSHNDANVLCLGARIVDLGEAEECLDMFLKTSFEGGRHQQRSKK